MQLVSMELKSSDPETLEVIRTQFRDLSQNLPAGARLVPAPPDDMNAIDPHVLSFALGFLGALAEGAAKEVGEQIIQWLITSLRERLKGKPATLVSGSQHLTITAVASSEDEQAFAQIVIEQSSSKK